MSNQNALNDPDSQVDDATLDSLPEPARKRLRDLERENRELRPLKDENDRFKLKETLRESGMDLSNKQLAALLAAHEGESNPEELRKTAEELKFVEPIPTTDTNDESGHKEIDNARNGAGDTPAQLTYEQEIEQANNKEELVAIMQKHGRAVAV